MMASFQEQRPALDALGFLSLPAEVRNMVYKHIIGPNGCLKTTLQHDGGEPEKPVAYFERSIRHLAATCHLVHGEISPLLKLEQVISTADWAEWFTLADREQYPVRIVPFRTQQAQVAAVAQCIVIEEPFGGWGVFDDDDFVLGPDYNGILKDDSAVQFYRFEKLQTLTLMARVRRDEFQGDEDSQTGRRITNIEGLRCFILGEGLYRRESFEHCFGVRDRVIELTINDVTRVDDENEAMQNNWQDLVRYLRLTQQDRVSKC